MPATQPAVPAKVVVLTGGGPLPWIVINALVARLGPVTVLEEEPESLATLFRRRLKRLGPVTVVGQIAFGFWQRLLSKSSARRRAEIIARDGLDPTPSSVCPRIAVGSVNSPECRAALERLQPKVVLVIGTRMIGRETLRAVDAPFINYHAGINPKYRGMCGGYWSLATGDEDNFGVTVHLVDEGVDTGGILGWAKSERGPSDNFATYPLLLASTARNVVIEAVEEALDGRLRAFTRDLPSHQWYHPTLWGYLANGLVRGVW